ncbi:MAG TPA: alpha/beta hydrolase [Longimicrobiaceae bacterium]|nr:alpha/beta hydrolase [Longimicrobiaceae bacterium]
MLQQQTVDGIEWSYSDRGPKQAEVLLVLPGALGAIDLAGAVLDGLAGDRRVVALAYPAVPTMTALCDGIVGLLDRLAISRADVLGSSLGGYVAQCLVRRHPDRVGHLVLSHTFVLGPRDARRFRLANRISAWIPAPLFRALLRVRLRSVLRPLARAGRREDVDALLRSAAVGSLTAATVARFNDWMMEGALAFPITPHDLAGHGGGVMIIESGDDPVIRPRDRAALRAAYPAARVCTFRGGGHATSLVMPDAYARAVTAFLDGTTPSGCNPPRAMGRGALRQAPA